MLADCTYGVGVGPCRIVNAFYTALQTGFYRKDYTIVEDQYGRDLDRTNNKGAVAENLIPYCYYASAEGHPYQNEFSSYPNPTEQLIPNDSRMFKLKLTLWRLLKPETDPATEAVADEWKRKLSFMNIGMATTYIEEYFYNAFRNFSHYKYSLYDAYTTTTTKSYLFAENASDNNNFAFTPTTFQVFEN